MLQTVFPVLPALIVAHAWMTMIIAHTLSGVHLRAAAGEFSGLNFINLSSRRRRFAAIDSLVAVQQE
jgi:hypothetical protein